MCECVVLYPGSGLDVGESILKLGGVGVDGGEGVSMSMSGVRVHDGESEFTFK